jgi:hypothetical protein
MPAVRGLKIDPNQRKAWNSERKLSVDFKARPCGWPNLTEIPASGMYRCQGVYILGETRLYVLYISADVQSKAFTIAPFRMQWPATVLLFPLFPTLLALINGCLFSPDSCHKSLKPTHGFLGQSGFNPLTAAKFFFWILSWKFARLLINIYKKIVFWRFLIICL